MKFHEYEIQLLRADDQDYEKKARQVLKICDEFLGKGLYSEKRLEDICRRDSHYFYLIMKSGKVVGIYYCYAALFSDVNFLKDVQIAGVRENTRIGVAQSIAFKKELWGKYLAEKLHNDFMDKLFEQENVPVIFIPAWKNGDHIPAKNILETCSCEMVQTVKTPWKDITDLVCPACGQSPCICDGVIYMKKRERQ